MVPPVTMAFVSRCVSPVVEVAMLVVQINPDLSVLPRDVLV